MMRIGNPMLLGVLLLASAALAAEQKDAPPISGQLNTIAPESAEARKARHEKVAARRAQPALVLLHRGAHKFAPENTIEAYAAAMDYGADGNEIDIRRSADGVIYLFHDDTLDRMTTGTGKLAGLTYARLLQARFKNAKGIKPEPRIPTLAASLEIARQRAMLLHLDVKEPGLEDELIRIFDEADVWDHMVSINAGNAEKILKHDGVRLEDYKGWVEQQGDLSNLDIVKKFLAIPQKMIFCEGDPIPALKILDRDGSYRPVALPESIRRDLQTN